MFDPASQKVSGVTASFPLEAIRIFVVAGTIGVLAEQESHQKCGVMTQRNLAWLVPKGNNCDAQIDCHPRPLDSPCPASHSHLCNTKRGAFYDCSSLDGAAGSSMSSVFHVIFSGCVGSGVSWPVCDTIVPYAQAGHGGGWSCVYHVHSW